LKLKDKNDKLEEQMKQAQLASQSTLRDQLKANIDQETAKHKEVVTNLEK
jgi:tripartite-type tricarboxylate transporter receptor subunit TctC